MKPKVLVLVLTAITLCVWIGCAVVSLRAAVMPLCGILPFVIWSSINGSGWYLLLIPIVIYLSVPVLAWTRESRRFAWFIPIAPLVGVTLFYAQLRFAGYIAEQVMS